MSKFLLLLSTTIFFCACNPPTTELSGKVDAYVPVYASLAGVEQVSVQTQQSTKEAGKIYAYGNYIFQNDVNSGIHIIDK